MSIIDWRKVIHHYSGGLGAMLKVFLFSCCTKMVVRIVWAAREPYSFDKAGMIFCLVRYAIEPLVYSYSEDGKGILAWASTCKGSVKTLF